GVFSFCFSPSERKRSGNCLRNSAVTSNPAAAKALPNALRSPPPAGLTWQTEHLPRSSGRENVLAAKIFRYSGRACMVLTVTGPISTTAERMISNLTKQTFDMAVISTPNSVSGQGGCDKRTSVFGKTIELHIQRLHFQYSSSWSQFIAPPLPFGYDSSPTKSRAASGRRPPARCFHQKAVCPRRAWRYSGSRALRSRRSPPLCNRAGDLRAGGRGGRKIRRRCLVRHSDAHGTSRTSACKFPPRQSHSLLWAARDWAAPEHAARLTHAPPGRAAGLPRPVVAGQR